MERDKNDWQKILKPVLLVISGFVLLQFIVFVGSVVWFVISASSAAKIDASVVREEFENSVLPSAPYFAITEDKSKVKKDKIFLNIRGVNADAYYVCGLAGFAKVCHIEIDDSTLGMDGVGLGEYFWGLHRSEIESMLAKYPNLRLSGGEEIEIVVANNDRVAANSFVKDLLKIPDMYNLYQACKASRRGSTSYCRAFGNFWMEFYDETGAWLRGGLLLFSWAEENGF